MDEKVKVIGKCSADLWEIFKSLTTGDLSNKEAVIKNALLVFRDKVQEYEGTDAYNYANYYANVLIKQLEDLLYSFRVAKSNYFDIKNMTAWEFFSYMAKPNPRDCITVTYDNGNIVRIKIESVINYE